MESEYFGNMILGALMCFVLGATVIDDELSQQDLKQAVYSCGGIENILKIDTDAVDTVVCIDDLEYKIRKGDVGLFSTARYYGDESESVNTGDFVEDKK